MLEYREIPDLEHFFNFNNFFFWYVKNKSRMSDTVFIFQFM